MDIIPSPDNQTPSSLTPADLAMIQDVADYLQQFSTRLTRIRRQLEGTSWWRTKVNQVTWSIHRFELERLESELFQWTQRFDLRLLGLPRKARTAILSLDDDTTSIKPADNNAVAFTPALRIQHKVTSFLSVSTVLQNEIVKSLEIAMDGEGAPAPLSAEQNHSSRRFQRIKDRIVLTEFRMYDNTIPWAERQLQVGKLSAVLNQADPHTIGLLRCIGYFKNLNQSPGQKSYFGLAYSLPFTINQSPPSLKELLEREEPRNKRRLRADHPLNRRLVLVRRLARSLYFLHAIGWVHKAIRSQNVLVLEPAATDAKSRFPYSIGLPVLLGFTLAREGHVVSDLTQNATAARWDLDLYQHPDRQGLRARERFVAAHDIYSFGVVMLEVGLWRPLNLWSAKFEGMNGERMREGLLSLTRECAVFMGERYKSIVEWCLERATSDEENPSLFITKVLEPLEQMTDAMS